MISKSLLRFFCLFLFCVIAAFPNPYLYAQENDDFEVYLSFRHRGVINSVVVSYYKDDAFYIPFNEIFSLFQIETNIEGLTTSGNFSTEQIPYKIDFETRLIEFGDSRFSLDQEDLLIKELDNYLNLEIFTKVFGLEFSVDLNSLALNLNTQRELPIIQRILRSRKRQIADQNRLVSQDLHPLTSGREFRFFDGGFMDYSISSILREDKNNLNFASSVGVQLFGGDLQGTTYGSFSSESNLIETENLRWRFFIRENKFISKIILGQTTSDGVLSSPYTGIRLTNDPIEPRRLFDEFEIQGNTLPNSEVELFMNNTLIDFQPVDEIGNYRFLVPLTYGASQLNIRIFGPYGQVINRRSRVQIPFTFLPKGELTYSINAGALNNTLPTISESSTLFQANTTYGITKWLTYKAGVEYFEGSENSKPTYTSRLSTRINRNYIVTLEGVSSGYLRSVINAVYANSASFSIDYSKYLTEFGLYNTGGFKNQLVANVFYPFKIFTLPVNIRTSTFTRFRETFYFSTFRFDLSTRIQRLNLRTTYSDRLIDTINPLENTESSYFETALTYNISNSPNISRIIRGTFLRSQIRYLLKPQKIESTQLLFSKSIFKRGRFQLSLGRNFVTGFNSIRFNFVIDLDKVRFNTTASTVRNSFTSTQNIRGSVGYDTNYNNLLLSSRDQVGRSGAAVKMFVDNNGNNEFDNDDQIIDEGTIRIGRSGASAINKNGVLYYTQMQPYFQYNLEMNKGSIRNPMLVPELDKFSIITDPNTFKKIEIPFYMSGIIEGEVIRKFENGNNKPVGGLKLVLSSTEKDFNKEIRTYSDGSFYEYELPPGKYEIAVDQSQLDILNSKSSPEKIELEIKAIPEGDFLEGVNFTLLPIDFEEQQQEEETITETPLTLSEVPEEIKNSQEIIQLEQQLVTNVEKALRLIILTQNAFFERDFESAFGYINESLQNFETAQGYALKGSIQYFQGDRTGAVASWRMALRFDPDIYIPTLEELDQRVTVSSSE